MRVMLHCDELRLPHPAAAAARELPALLRRVQADYREMPGLMLNRAQMQRLWSIDALVCDALIESLVESQVVRRVRRDTYVAFGPSA